MTQYPEYFRKREWFHFDRSGARRTYVLASDVVFLKAVRNTVLFVLVVAPLQAGLALGLALLINRQSARDQLFPHDLLHACRDFDGGRLDALAVYL